MSDNVIEASKHLNKIIIESEEYQKLCLYQKELEQYPELFGRIQEFRKKNFEIRVDENLDDSEQALQLAKDYRDVLENPMSASYLNAELGFCKMMQAVMRNICKDVDIDVDFI